MIDALFTGAVVLFLIMLNGFFVGAEFALLASPRAKIEILAGKGHKAAKLLHALHNDQKMQDRYIATAQFGITVASLGLGMFGEEKLAEMFANGLAGFSVFSLADSHAISITASLVLLTYLHIVIGEMVPKSLSLAKPDVAGLALTIPMMAIIKITLPFVVPLSWCGSLVLKHLGLPVNAMDTQVHSPEELELMVEESQEAGDLEEDQSEMLLNLLRFSAIHVRKVMVPRNKVEGIDLEHGFRNALEQVATSRHTRYPVFEGSLDDIKGIVHVKELFNELRNHPDDPLLIRAMRPALFVPEQITVEDLLAEFRKNGTQMAVVVDEYGGMAGIVSLEDVLEEIFGEVQDEFDLEEPTHLRISEDKALLLGSIRLDEIKDEFGIDLSHPDFDTLGGLILAKLGRQASVGDVVNCPGASFRVVALDGLAVSRVEMTCTSQDLT